MRDFRVEIYDLRYWNAKEAQRRIEAFTLLMDRPPTVYVEGNVNDSEGETAFLRGWPTQAQLVTEGFNRAHWLIEVDGINNYYPVNQGAPYRVYFA